VASIHVLAQAARSCFIDRTPVRRAVDVVVDSSFEFATDRSAFLCV